MKKIFLLCLLLGVFCFSSDGFKEVNWGASQKSVIEYLGPNYKIDKTNILIYENVPFANFNLSNIKFKFKDDKLIEWEGYGYPTGREVSELRDAYSKKYGKEVSSYKESKSDVLTYADKNGFIKMTLTDVGLLGYVLKLTYSVLDAGEKLSDI